MTDGTWTFSCNVCSFERDADTESEAVVIAGNHADYGRGHFDYTITGPDGVEQYP